MPKFLFCCLMGFAWAPQILAASFDCAKAKTQIELAICANEALSDLDSRLMHAYQNALARSDDQNAIKSDQRLWLKVVRNKCLNSECLVNAYRTRIEELDTTRTYNNEPISCRKEIGEKKAMILVEQCIQISPATRPPCNDLNPCWMIRDEIKRGCEIAKEVPGLGVPEFCE